MISLRYESFTELLICHVYYSEPYPAVWFIWQVNGLNILSFPRFTWQCIIITIVHSHEAARENIDVRDILYALQEVLLGYVRDDGF